MSLPRGTVVDYYPGSTTALLARCVKANGHLGTVLYVNRSTRADVDAILASGQELFLVYELMPANPPPDFFSPARGKAHAEDAIASFERLGLPRRPCYFAVDRNIDPATMDPYFNAVDPILDATPVLDGGVYGYKPLIDYARAKYGHLGRHLWQTYGPDPLDTVDLWQYLQRDECGTTLDVNACYVSGLGDEMDDQTFRSKLVQMLNDPTVEAEINKFTAVDNALAEDAARLRALESDAHDHPISVVKLGATPAIIPPPAPLPSPATIPPDTRPDAGH